MTDEELSSNAENDSVLHGFVKWFNIAKGFGFITRNDGGEDVFVHQSAIKSIGYRTLAEGEQVTFKITDSDKGQIAVCVTSKSSGDVKGVTRRNRTKQGARKYTSLCFNCNKGGHKAKNCPYERTTDRTCHKCGSNMHIIRKCPLILASVKENKDNGLTKDGQRKSHHSEESSTEINEKVIHINHNHEPLS